MKHPRVLIKHLLKRFVSLIEYCRDCGVRQPLVWTASNELWEEVWGGTGGVLCPKCFDKRADLLGIALRWDPKEEYRFRKATSQ